MARIQYKIVNMVASANLKREVDLYSLAREVPDVEYEPEQFPGAIIKMKDPKAAILIFQNGKIICSGAPSEDAVKKALNKAYNMIKDYLK